jgi:hypothetical protein
MLGAAGFARIQYSVRENPACTAAWAYVTAVNLRSIQPLGLLPTTVAGLRGYFHLPTRLCWM